MKKAKQKKELNPVERSIRALSRSVKMMQTRQETIRWHARRNCRDLQKKIDRNVILVKALKKGLIKP